MQLISEVMEESKLIIEKAEDGTAKNYFIEGIFMQSGIKNRNGRIYPKEIMERQLQSYNETFVAKGRALGELGHPENPTVNLERVSHNIVQLGYSNGTDIIGKAKLMDTPYGNIAKAMVREGVQLGVSSRGLGSIKESNGARVVQNDFYLAAVDIVADPSAPSAFVNGIMENREWVYENGILVERQIEAIQDHMNDAARKGMTAQAELAVWEAVIAKQR